jgi:hypothetical protein
MNAHAAQGDHQAAAPTPTGSSQATAKKAGLAGRTGFMR